MLLRFEGITATQRYEFITVRVYAIIPGRTPINCGQLIMFQADFATLALRPPLESELVSVDCVMTEGTIEEYLEGLLGSAAHAA